MRASPGPERTGLEGGAHDHRDVRLPELGDGVVLLRPMTLDDAADHLAGQDEDQRRWLSGRVSTDDTVRAWIRANLASWETGGPRRSFGVREVSTGNLVGMVEADLAVAGLAPGVANVSYALYPHARHRGLATRAVLLLCEHLHASGTAHTAVIQVDPENRTSLALASRAEFRPAGAWRAPDGRSLATFVRRLS
jgi:RimJ/RimL family protein N-acetyltransferase